MSLLTSPFFSIAIDLICEFVRGRAPPTTERQRSKGRQTDAEERLRGCDGLSDDHSKGLLDCPPIGYIMSWTIDNGEPIAIPHRILGFHWLLELKISN
jgi:hypothetical protein